MFFICYHVSIVFIVLISCIFLVIFNLIKITQLQFDEIHWNAQWKNMIFLN